MTRINDKFCGYLKIDDDVFSYFVSDHAVTLLPAQDDPAKRHQALSRANARDMSFPEYFFGKEDLHEIAILRNRQFNHGFWGMNPSIRFGTPVIVKATGNASGFYEQLTTDWDKFHAITFFGGNINAIFDPQLAVVRPPLDEFIKMGSTGAIEIKVRPWAEYTRTADCEIDGEKAKLTISVMTTGGTSMPDHMKSYSLGELSSFLRLTFENEQGFGKIARYHGVIKSLVAILTLRNNVFFGANLSQRNASDQFFSTGICKIYDDYENYSTRKWDQVVPIHSVLEWLPKMIESIANNEASSLLAVLPENNKHVGQITITNVQDLCTALEVAHTWDKRSRKKDALVGKLKKKIREAISDFAKSHDGIDVDKETTISSAFQYLDYTLKQKILTLYKENSEVVEPIIAKHGLPKVDEENVGAFIKLRNEKTHSGKIEWGESANLYIVLLALEYTCFFKHIGMPEEAIKPALLQLF